MTWPAFSLGVWGYPERMDPRVPPGQFVTERFPILTYGETPKVAKEAWRLEVTGLVETPLVLTYEDLLARPQVELTRDFHCVTRWSRQGQKEDEEGLVEAELVPVRPHAPNIRLSLYVSGVKGTIPGPPPRRKPLEVPRGGGRASPP